MEIEFPTANTALYSHVCGASSVFERVCLLYVKRKVYWICQLAMTN